MSFLANSLNWLELSAAPYRLERISMKNVKLLGAAIVIISMAIALVMAIRMGEKSPIYVSGTISLEQGLEDRARGINTLYIIVYDAESQMPMPYGAVRKRLSEPATPGAFREFSITREKLQLMNENLPSPRYMRIKARLDLDGIAGMDQPGDLTGEVERVVFGSEGVDIHIDHYVSSM